LNTLIKIFRADLTGVPSLEIVRLLNRMIKERRFGVHPRVLSALLHLRLKTELPARAPETHGGPATQSKSRTAARRAKGKPTDQPHLTKKSKKALKEKVEIEREFREAEAQVDKEERAAVVRPCSFFTRGLHLTTPFQHTETLKLVFVLYFTILKNPHPTPLLPTVLQGISKYAHLVNVDFFEDLLKALKGLISQRLQEGRDDVNSSGIIEDVSGIRRRLLCVVTAFELLSGQGQFNSHGYSIKSYI
jgi:nucleolar complex protein 3